LAYEDIILHLLIDTQSRVRLPAAGSAFVVPGSSQASTVNWYAPSGRAGYAASLFGSPPMSNAVKTCGSVNSFQSCCEHGKSQHWAVAQPSKGKGIRARSRELLVGKDSYIKAAIDETELVGRLERRRPTRCGLCPSALANVTLSSGSNSLPNVDLDPGRATLAFGPRPAADAKIKSCTKRDSRPGR